MGRIERVGLVSFLNSLRRSVTGLSLVMHHTDIVALWAWWTLTRMWRAFVGDWSREGSRDRPPLHVPPLLLPRDSHLRR